MEHKHRFHTRMLDALWRSATALPGRELSERWFNGWVLILLAGYFVVMAIDGTEYWHHIAWTIGWGLFGGLFDHWRFGRWRRSARDLGAGGGEVGGQAP